MTSFKDDLLSMLPKLRAFARALCSNSAMVDDLVQETILRAWANQSTFQVGTNIRAWLFTIMRNYYYNEIRRKKRLVDLDGKNGPLDIVVGESQPTCLHLKDLERELASLPIEQREVLILVSVGGFSYEEVAKICNCAVGTIKSRVARARAQLLDRLEGADVGATAAPGLSSVVFSARTT